MTKDIETLISRPGQNGQQGDPRALFRTEFMADIIAAYETSCQYRDRHRIHSLKNGESATFPAIGGTKAVPHQAGAFIEGEKFNHGNIKISLDVPILTSVYIADFEEKMATEDFRTHYSREMGIALATSFDQNVARVALLAARQKPLFAGGEGGSVIKGGKDVATNAELIKDVIFKAMEIFDIKNVPATERYCFVSPTTYAAASANTDLINKNWGGEGSLALGRLGTVAGIELIKTNHIPKTNQTADNSVFEKYRGDFSKTAFHFMHKDAVGTVVLIPTQASIDWIPTNKTTLLTAQYLAGHGVLRPECAIEVTSEDTTPPAPPPKPKA